jgi:cytochrome P450
MAALVTELDLPELDVSDPELRGARWHEAMAGLGESGAWLARAPLATVVLDREAGEHFLRTKAAIFPGKLIAQLFGIADGPLHEQIEANIINTSGDEHRRLRALVNPALAPRAVARYRPAMREFLADLWAPVDGVGRCDLVEALCRPYPARTIATVMGAPLDDAPRLHDWSMWIQRQFDPIALSDPEQLATIQRKAGEFYDWVRPLIARRRHEPADDLISSLIAAEEAGDRLTDKELENLVLNILVGGVDTTQSQLAHAVRLLAGRPDQWAALRADPEALAPRAAEEALRFEPITPFTARLLVEEVTYRDVTFPEGTVIMVCAFSGNRDPEAFAHPETFDITGEPGSARMLTFGAGIHYCVGANLARAELEEALAFLARRVRTLRLDGEPVLQSVSGIYGTDALPVAFDTA